MSDFLPENDRITISEPAAGTVLLPFDFSLESTAELTVTLLRANIQLQLDDADWSIVTHNGDGGTVKLVTASVAGDLYAVFGDTISRRETDFKYKNKISTLALNGEMDRQVRITQELRRDLSNSVSFPVGTPASVPRVMPVGVEGYALIGKADGGYDAKGFNAVDIAAAQTYSAAAEAAQAAAEAARDLAIAAVPPIFINNDLTLEVPADHATPYDAMVYLQDKQIKNGVAVTINVAAGVYTQTLPFPNHPQATDITIIGPVIAAFPVEADFTVTGSDPASRAADNIVHLDMLRAKHNVEIICDSCSPIYSTKGKNAVTVRNLLFSAINSVAVCVRIYSGIGDFSHISVHGFGATNIAMVNSGHWRGNWLTSSGASIYGAQTSDQSDIKITEGAGFISNGSSGLFMKRNGCQESANSFSIGNGGAGYDGQDSGTIDVPGSRAVGNAGDGIRHQLGGLTVATDFHSEGNGGFGANAVDGGSIQFNNSTALNNGAGNLFATGVGSGITAKGCTFGPTPGSNVRAGYGGEINITNSTLDGAAIHNIYVDFGGRVYVTNLVNLNAGASGAFVADGGELIGLNYTVYGAASSGVHIAYGGNCYLRNPTFGGAGAGQGLGSNGLYIQEGGRAYLRGADFNTCGGRGVYVLRGGEVDIAYGSFANITNKDIQVLDKGSVRVQGIDLTGLNISGHVDADELLVTPPLKPKNLGEAVLEVITAGVVAVNSPRTAIETQSGDPTDDVETITGTKQGDVIILEAYDGGHTVVLKHAAVGGNLRLTGNADVSLSSLHDNITLLNTDGTNLKQIAVG